MGFPEADQPVTIYFSEFYLVQGIYQGRVPGGFNLHIVFGEPMDISLLIFPFKQDSSHCSELALIKGPSFFN